MISLPPNFSTNTTRKGNTILYPRVPIKFTNKMGKRGDFEGLLMSLVIDCIHLKKRTIWFYLQPGLVIHGEKIFLLLIIPFRRDRSFINRRCARWKAEKEVRQKLV